MPIESKYDDGTPRYNKEVRESCRNLQFRSCIYAEPPAAGKGVRLGVYQAQAECGAGATENNIARLADIAEMAAKQRVQLLSFPELYLQGYTQSPESARNVAVSINSSEVDLCRKAAQKNCLALVIGYAEKDDTGADAKFYDSIVVIGPDGDTLLNYRKTHLYAQQERDDWSFGMEPPSVFKVNGFPVGVLNCYENEFPELVRMLALDGAKLVVGPTAADGFYELSSGKRSNVPYPDVARTVLPALAYCNNLFYAYSNRCGYEERDGSQWHYRGNSIIIGPHGDILAEAEHERDTLLIADCLPEYYGITHPEPEYGYLKDRRPDVYGKLIEKEARFDGGYTYPDFRDGKEIEE